RLVGIERASFRYAAKRTDQSELEERMKAIAAERRRFGYRRPTYAAAAGRQGSQREAHLSGVSGTRADGTKAAAEEGCGGTAAASPPGAAESAVEHGLRERRPVEPSPHPVSDDVDDFTRECPAIEVDTSLPGARVIRVVVVQPKSDFRGF